MMIGITPAGIAAWTTSTRLSSTGQGSQRATHRMSTGRIPSRTAHAAPAARRCRKRALLLAMTKSARDYEEQTTRREQADILSEPFDGLNGLLTPYVSLSNLDIPKPKDVADAA